eukprot:4523365-Prymnesium_polylepis.1
MLSLRDRAIPLDQKGGRKEGRPEVRKGRTTKYDRQIRDVRLYRQQEGRKHQPQTDIPPIGSRPFTGNVTGNHHASTWAHGVIPC